MSWYPLKQGDIVFSSSLTGGAHPPLAVTVTSSTPVAEGSTAYVFRGKSGDNHVALKVFKNVGHQKDAGNLQLFRRELRAARRIRHPYILPTIAASHGRKILFFPFLKNGNLLEYLQANPDASRNALVLQVAEAVAYLHGNHGVAHGDLKCENVLVSDDGEARLADFGLSTIDRAQRQTTACIKATGWTTATTTDDDIRLRFTIGFAGPELLFADGIILPSKSSQSDVYAFGMLLIQAFTGSAPWPCCTLQDVLLKVHSHAQPSHPGDQATVLGLTDSWWDVCRWCLDPSPASRPSMLHVLAELWGSIPNRHLGLNNPPLFPPSAVPREFTSLHPHRRSPEKSFAITSRCTVLSHVADLDQKILSPGTFPFQTCSPSGGVSSVAFLSGTRLASGSWDAAVRIWDVITGTYTLASSVSRRGRRLHCVTTCPATGIVASASGNGIIYLWAPDSNRTLYVTKALHDHKTGVVFALAFSADGSRMICGCADGAIRVWNIATGALIGAPWVHSSMYFVVCAAFSSDGTRIVSGSEDTSLRLWEWSSGNDTLRPVGETLIGHTGWVSSCVFSPDGRLIASGSRDCTVRLWDANSRAPRFTLGGHEQMVNSVAFAPNGRHLASASNDRTVRIWDPLTGEAVQILLGHVHWVSSVAFSPDGTRIASGSEDETVRVWDFNPGSNELSGGDGVRKEPAQAA